MLKFLYLVLLPCVIQAHNPTWFDAAVPPESKGQYNMDPSLADVAPKHEFQPVLSMKAASGGPVSVSVGSTAQTLTLAVAIGTPSQSFQVLLDTGSSIFWVRGSSCNLGNGCAGNAFNQKQSTTFVVAPNRQPNVLQYGDGTQVQCTVHKDVVTLGPVSVDNTQFCSASEVQTPSSSPPMDGIVGLGPPGTDNDTPFFRFVRSGFGAAIVSFWFDPSVVTVVSNSALTSGAGIVTLGGVATDKFNGSIVWSPIVTSAGHWVLQLNSITLGGNSISTRSASSAIIDTGTTLVYLPTDMFNAINDAMGATINSDGTASIPCSGIKKLPTITFNLGNTQISLAPEKQILAIGRQCFTIFSPADGSDQLLIGASLLRHVYTVFDYDNARIGFAATVGDIGLPNIPSAAQKMGVGYVPLISTVVLSVLAIQAMAF